MSNDPASAEQRKRLDEAERKYQEEKAKRQIDIVIDNKSSEHLAQVLEKKLADVDGKDMTSIAEGVKDALRAKYAEKGHIAPSLETREDIENAVAILKDLPDRQKPSGVAPMNEKQGYFNNSNNPDLNTPLAQKVYSSYEEMMQDLHDIETVFKGSPKGQEATRYIEQITAKFFQEHKQNNSPVANLDRPLPELISVNGLLVPKDPTQGDLQQWNRNYRRRKAIERVERGVVVGQEGEK